ncbi:TRAM domain-containing protein, partial [Clostridium perfringens]
VGRADGYTLFVQGALPGEKARVKVLKTKKQYGYAKLLELVEQSPNRIAAPCPIYDQCGGCQLQHMNYAGQLEWKRQLVVDNLERIGKLRVVREAEGAGETRAGDERSGTDGGGEIENSATNGAHPAVSGVASAQEGILVRPTRGMRAPWRYRPQSQ